MLPLLKKLLFNLEEVICSILLSTLIILMGIQVFSRFTIGSASPIFEEVSRFCLVGFIYFGAALGAKLGEHYRVVVYQLIFKEKTVKIISLIGDLLWLGFSVVMVFFGWRFVQSVIEYPYLSPALMIPMKFIYPIIPLGYSLIIFRMIYFNINKIRTESEEN